MEFERIFFFATAGVAVVSAYFTVTRRNPVQSVLFLIVNFFCLALLYLGLHAQFIAIIQILVYAGAIMVLFLFVIMLLNLGDEKALTEKRGYQKTLAVILSIVVFIQVMILLGNTGFPPVRPLPADFGSAESVGRDLFSTYLLPFEATSILLLAALVGVVVLAKKKLD